VEADRGVGGRIVVGPRGAGEGEGSPKIRERSLARAWILKEACGS
jgi:hypothetical protein